MQPVSNINSAQQTSCRQCGECCINGGAALHSADIGLLLDKLIPRTDLITIRKGEFAHNPISNKVQATRSEIVKLRGSGSDWMCCYYDKENRACSIYSTRPLACRTLKCWEPEESLALVETDLLSRHDILEGEDELRELVARYEEACLLPDFNGLSLDITHEPESCTAALEKLVNADIQFRDRAVQDSPVVAAEELFLFGRPLFQLLQPFGFAVFQVGNTLRLQWKGK